MARVLPELTRITDLDHARAVAGPGARLDAVRSAARRLKNRLHQAGPATCVRTWDLVTFPYPTRYGLQDAPRSPAPYLMMTNRMHLVQVRSQGTLINVLVNPSDPERSLEAPFFARQLERYGELVVRRILSRQHGRVDRALARFGVAPEDIDYITFDHLHAQDVRGWLGTDEPEPGFSQPTRAYLPNARLLVQAEELCALEHLHPLQAPWYVRDGLRSVPPGKIIALSGDYLIGPGLALIRTPGHTEGNCSIAVVTDRGIWTISENGIAVDAYAPAHSRIRGLGAYAAEHGVEVILNANTRENSLDQYISMVLEKTLADPCPDRPEFPQHFSSSELTRSRLAPGLAPTYTHGAITHDDVAARR